MGNADNPSAASGQQASDLLIVGGGIMGLWAAVHAERRGIDTLLVDAGPLGQGASGGLLGALMPYMPDRWEDKKQFQFDALVSLEAEIAALEAETGLSAGYRRSGKLIPLPKPHLRTIALRHSRDAEQNWHQGGHRFDWQVLDAPPVNGWVDPAAGTGGFVLDTLAARVFPRGLTAVLVAFLRTARHVRIVEGLEARSIDPVSGIATFADGQVVGFGHCILSAGYRSFPFLDAVSRPLPVSLGQAVKGQAALLKADIDPSWPVVFLDGLYIVPHEDGHVAVGSTSENTFTQAETTDHLLDAVLTSARAIIPGLSGAPVIERWAGLRPKAIDRDPMVGPHPDHPRLVALTGGFKISFGLAHSLASAAIDVVSGGSLPAALPTGFTLASHIDVASQKR